MTLDDIPSAWKGHRGFARWLTQHMQPQVTVDLGVDYGYSTFALAEHNPGHVYGLDTFAGDAHAGFRDTYSQAHSYRQQLGLNNITFIPGLFADTARSWHQPIDILHIDGLHTREAVTEDYETWSPHVRSTGVILFHDTQAFAQVGEVVRHIPGYVGEFHHSAGLGIVCTHDVLVKEIQKWLQ
jgi:predicted O-methyltransferase YrrM